MQIRCHQPIAHAANLRHIAPPTAASVANVPTEEVELSVAPAAAEAGRSSGLGGLAKTAAMVGLALTGMSLLAGCDGAPPSQGSGTSQSQPTSQRYNWTTGEFEHAKEGDKLRYNVWEGEFEYAGKNDKMRYNWAEGKMERAPADAKLQYNWLSGKFEYR